MVDGVAALMFGGVFTLTLLPLVMVYRMPEHNALDEAAKDDHFNSQVKLVVERTGNGMNLFQKAQAGLNLTPGQRAFLKLLQGFALAGVQSLIVAAPSVLALKEGQPVLAAGGFGIMVGAFVHGFLAAWQKYASAKGDAPLANTLGQMESALDAAFGLNEPVVEPPVSPTPPDDGGPAQAQQPQAA